MTKRTPFLELPHKPLISATAGLCPNAENQARSVLSAFMASKRGALWLSHLLSPDHMAPFPTDFSSTQPHSNPIAQSDLGPA